MNKIRIIPLLLVLTAVVLTACAPKEPAPAARPKGYLFIVGGGDRDEPLMRRYVELARRNGPAKIAIFTMASSVPLETGPGLVAEFKGYGVEAAAYYHLTREEALDPAKVKILDGVTGVWFAGGDIRVIKPRIGGGFGGKQEILLELLNRALDLLIEKVSRAIEEPALPDERLRRAMRIYLQTLAEYQDLAAVLLLEHRSLEPEFQSRQTPRRDRFERIWRDLIVEGPESGIFSCTHPSLTARALLGVMNWTVTWYHQDWALSAYEIAEQFANLFLLGLMARNGVFVNRSDITNEATFDACCRRSRFCQITAARCATWVTRA